MKYDHKVIEKKWRLEWEKNRIYTAPDKVPGKGNFYLLVEFPYPSGNLHVGHWYAFAVPDILARAKRMQGKNVLFPIGFDAFGLPAENAAIKNKLNPRKWTYDNIAHMTKQIESMGTSFDWSRKVITADPEYYKWTQWLFLQFYKKGLVYQRETAVNWCPKDQTVLANEQVVDGKCERCDSEVIQRQMLQWNIKITDYADRLIDDLAPLDWPEQIKASQRNWIGRSEGAEIDFYLDFGDPVVNDRTGPDGKKANITVFTTRPDTLFGATYLVLAPEHPWVTLALGHKTVLKNNDEVEAYVNASKKKTELERMTDQKDKTGVRLEGVEAINPATGEKIPLFVADYVLGHYGTGAIMAVPAHDERDYEFAKKFELPIKQVVMPVFGIENKGRPDAVFRETVTAVVKRSDGKVMLLNWPALNWLTAPLGGIEEGESAEAAAVREVLEETGYKTRALSVSPITIESHFYADHKKEWRSRIDHVVALELSEENPGDVDPAEVAKHTPEWKTVQEAMQSTMFENNKLAFDLILGNAKTYSGTKYSEVQQLVNSGDFSGITVDEAKAAMTAKFGRAKKTYKLRDWIVSRQRYWGVPIPMIHCEKCGIQAVPDQELPVVLPEVEDYLPSGEGKSPLAKVDSFVNVTCPNCAGAAKRETDTLDTFVDSSWYYLRYTDAKNDSEFASRERQDNWMPIDLYSGGAEHTTMHVLYSRFWQKALYDLGLVKDAEPYTRRMNRSLILGPDGQKMSKSKGNVIDPDEVVERLGSDTVRMYLAFIGPYSEVSSYPWNPDGVVGVRRFLERLSRAEELVVDTENKNLESLLHKATKKITEDTEAMKFNTAISQLMIVLNAIEKEKSIGKLQWKRLIQMLAPFAPHLAEELWYNAGNSTSVHLEAWPTFDESKLVEENVVIAIQIDGKMRGEVTMPYDSSKDDIEAAAKAAVAERLEGQEILRAIVVPNRLVNFVLKK